MEEDFLKFLAAMAARYGIDNKEAISDPLNFMNTKNMCGHERKNRMWSAIAMPTLGMLNNVTVDFPNWKQILHSHLFVILQLVQDRSPEGTEDFLQGCALLVARLAVLSRYHDNDNCKLIVDHLQDMMGIEFSKAELDEIEHDMDSMDASVYLTAANVFSDENTANFLKIVPRKK